MLRRSTISAEHCLACGSDLDFLGPILFFCSALPSSMLSFEVDGPYRFRRAERDSLYPSVPMQRKRPAFSGGALYAFGKVGEEAYFSSSSSRMKDTSRSSVFTRSPGTT